MDMTTLLAWAYSLISVVVISIISLIGLVTLGMKKEFLKKTLQLLVAFAAGSLLGDTFLHLMPEAMEEIGSALQLGILILTGIIIFFILEKIIHWRHCHIPTSHGHPHPFAITNLIGDALHNFLDGFAIAAAYIVNVPLGIATTIAVALHEIPQEIGDFGILLYGGFSKHKALVINFLTALTAVLGAIAALLIGSFAGSYTKSIIAITAGGFIYIASSDLIPELHKESISGKSTLQLLSILAGIGIMGLLLMLE